MKKNKLKILLFSTSIIPFAGIVAACTNNSNDAIETNKNLNDPSEEKLKEDNNNFEEKNDNNQKEKNEQPDEKNSRYSFKYDEKGNRIIKHIHPDEALEIIKNNPNEFVYSSDELLKDGDFVLQLIKIEPHIITFFDEMYNTTSLKYISREDNFYWDLLQYALLTEPTVLKELKVTINWNDKFWSDFYKNYFRTKLQSNPSLIQYMGSMFEINSVEDPLYKIILTEFPDYKNFIKNKLLEDPSLTYTDENPKYFLLENPKAIQHFGTRVRGDFAIVYQLFEKDPTVLQFATTQITDSDYLFPTFLNLNGLSLKYGTERIRNNEAMVITAILNNPDALEFASDLLKDRKSVVIEAIKLKKDTIKWASERLKNNKEIQEILNR